MELFLNLCWVSLLLPAYFLWRQRTSSTSPDGRVKSAASDTLIFLCALGCAFVLLFPVISATDDLHAMRAEMEESSLGLISDGRLELFTLPLSIPAAPSTLRASRAPPCSRLA